VLTRFGSLAGRILIEPEQLEADLRVEVRSAAGVVAGEGGKTSTPTFTGPRRSEAHHFSFAELPVGSYTLAILTPDGGEVLRVLHDVPVLAGETAQDPRLDPIDLRGTLPRITLSVRDAGGSPIDKAWVSCRRGAAWQGRQPIRSGRVALRFDGEPLEVKVEAFGYREQVLWPSADQEVILEPGLPVRIVIAGLEELASHAFEVRFGGDHTQTLDARGEARATLAPGDHPLELFLLHGTGRDRRRLGVRLSGLLRVEETGGEEQLCRLEALPGEPARLQQQLAKRAQMLSAGELRRRYGGRGRGR
jgi:hypothetical protein